MCKEIGRSGDHNKGEDRLINCSLRTSVRHPTELTIPELAQNAVVMLE